MTDTTRSYTYYVKPLSQLANEAIAERLNALGESAAALSTQVVEVDGKPIEGMYVVPHRMLTDLARTMHKGKVRVYVQEGSGQVRLYKHSPTTRKPLAETKAVRQAIQQISGKVPF